MCIIYIYIYTYIYNPLVLSNMYQNQATKKAKNILSVQDALKSVPLNVHSERTLASYVLRNLGYLDLTPTYLATVNH